MATKTIAREIAGLLQAIDNCAKSGNADWHIRHTQRLDALIKDHAPSGSGWDCGTTLDLQKSTPEKLIFTGSWHHMNDAGYYDGWTNHTITARASLVWGVDLRVSGRNRNGVKDYLGELFAGWLASPAP